MSIAILCGFIIFSIFIIGVMISRIRKKSFNENIKEMVFAFVAVFILSFILKIAIIIKVITVGVILILFCYGSTIKKSS